MTWRLIPLYLLIVLVVLTAAAGMQRQWEENGGRQVTRVTVSSGARP